MDNNDLLLCFNISTIIFIYLPIINERTNKQTKLYKRRFTAKEMNKREKNSKRKKNKRRRNEYHSHSLLLVVGFF